MMFFGFNGSVSVTDDPTQASQGTCPAGWVESSGVCIQVTSTAPSGLIETDPSKLPPTRFTWKMATALALLGAALGVGVHFFQRR